MSKEDERTACQAYCGSVDGRVKVNVDLSWYAIEVECVPEYRVDVK